MALSLVGEDLVTLPGDILESLLSTSLLRPSFLELFFTQLITIRWPSCTMLELDNGRYVCQSIYFIYLITLFYIVSKS